MCVRVILVTFGLGFWLFGCVAGWFGRSWWVLADFIVHFLGLPFSVGLL